MSEIHFELTKRMAELTGFRKGTVPVGDGRTLGDVLTLLANRFQDAGAVDLTDADGLHSSVLVVVDGAARSNRDLDMRLAGGETIGLFLPVAGG